MISLSPRVFLLAEKKKPRTPYLFHSRLFLSFPSAPLYYPSRVRVSAAISRVLDFYQPHQILRYIDCCRDNTSVLIMTKQKKDSATQFFSSANGIRCQEDEDHISQLPDDTLHVILSFLNTREGAGTCILSKRWRFLWSTSVSNLDFTHFNIIGCELTKDLLKEVKTYPMLNLKQYNPQLHVKPKLRLSQSPFKMRRKSFSEIKWTKKTDFLDIQTTHFIERVNQILRHNRVSMLNKFLVSFPLLKESTRCVDIWMKLAAVLGVRELELDFDRLDLGLASIEGMCYEFPIHQIGSSLNHLRLTFCTIKFPPHFQGLNSLASLTLTQSDFSNEDVQAILSHCPSLGSLNLRDCYSHYPTTLKFHGPSLPFLKHLHISQCVGIDKIDLQDINLLSFELQLARDMSFALRSRELKLSIKGAPFLARLAFHVSQLGTVKGSVQSLSNIPRLEMLYVLLEVSKLPNLNAFSNLKRLEFSVKHERSNLSEVLCFLEACPLLQQLHVYMTARFHTVKNVTGMDSEIAKRPECQHNYLKEVEIYGFDGFFESIALAKYLLNNALVLENMKICTTMKTYCSYVKRDDYMETNLPPLLTSLDEVRELLLKEKRATTKLLIVSS